MLENHLIQKLKLLWGELTRYQSNLTLDMNIN